MGHLDLAFTTAQRGRVYCAQSLLEVMEEPARLNRWEAAPTPPAA